jgi:hypothetical protein
LLFPLSYLCVYTSERMKSVKVFLTSTESRSDLEIANTCCKQVFDCLVPFSCNFKQWARLEGYIHFLSSVIHIFTWIMISIILKQLQHVSDYYKTATKASSYLRLTKLVSGSK